MLPWGPLFGDAFRGGLQHCQLCYRAGKQTHYVADDDATREARPVRRPSHFARNEAIWVRRIAPSRQQMNAPPHTSQAHFAPIPAAPE
jgi:hypothetical protein